MWPGFGENMRVLEWIIGRCEGQLDATETAIGYLPSKADINTEGLNMDMNVLDQLLSIDAGGWQAEAESVKKFLTRYGDRVPAELFSELKTLKDQL
jgi:phosphoenolpyruvate carboxykinase (GTP)